jgi:hypothetical protein
MLGGGQGPFPLPGEFHLQGREAPRQESLAREPGQACVKQKHLYVHNLLKRRIMKPI